MESSDKSAIENLAYRLWEQAGKPEGRAQEFCRQAERQLAGDREAADPPEDRLEWPLWISGLRSSVDFAATPVGDEP